MSRSLVLGFTFSLSLFTAACGGGGAASSAPSASATVPSGSGSTGTTTGTGSTTGTASTTGTGPTTGTGLGASPSAAATALGRPARLLIGLGAGNEPADIRAQALKPDIYDRYLVGPWPGSQGWPDWNQPRGAYVDAVAAAADAMGAVPMFTLYQLEVQGEANTDALKDTAFMTQVWTDTRLMFQRLGAYDKPALVNLEPDFWGFMLRAANGNPATVAAKVTIASECAGLTNDLKGVAGCMLVMARTHAPKARVGFPPSDWEFTAAQNIAWFKALGADRADFVVMQTLDRDAGCGELGAATCTGISPGPWYWDAAAYARHFALAKSYHDGLGLPLLWWQTPMGVPASGSGSVNRYRDNRVDHFLTHPAEVVAAGGFAVVFGAGADTQTAIPTDGGQFQRLSAAYLANPAALP